ncbi:MAG: acyl-CoA dehydrogenase, partial [Myxococcaceae bacterium]|nr:acyl-CoA dehydrogenase [Myxococcaceae bacterium]
MNPLLSDRFVDFLLYDVVDVVSLCKLPAFAHHGRETFDPWLAACRRVAREVLFPAYRAFDEQPPRFENGQVKVHPKMHAVFRELVDLGIISAARPPSVGGQQLPLTVMTLSGAYLMAGNLSAAGFFGLTQGA